MIWLKRILFGLLALVALVVFGVWLSLRASLAQLDGERTLEGVSAPLELSRDERGYVTVTGENRLDVARGLGFVHAQERFFQMDLMRRNAAGELSALVGDKALPLDQSRRWHRFRHRAETAIAALAAPERAVLDAYVAGVNAGLQALSARPPEYLLLRKLPQPWTAADTALVTYGMYLDLQGEQGRDDLAMGRLKAALPADWYAFLAQQSGDWQAAMDDSRVEPVPVPASPMPELLKTAQTAQAAACEVCSLRDGRDIGSNNFAVAGSRSTHGQAILGDDMHLGLRVPGIWFKARMVWKAEGRSFDEAGVTLPGAPLLVAGSNGHVAWGFTNTTSDWADVVTLKLNAAGTHYLSGGTEKPLQKVVEKIDLGDGRSADFEVLESEWGPVMPQKAPAGQAYVLRWVAHDPQGLNLRLMQMEAAQTVDDALKVAPGTGMPAQNLLVADSSGRIAWSVIGAMPRRVGVEDMDVPQDWSDGRARWQGYLGYDEQPRLVDPKDGRLWSANSRMVGGAAMKLLGNGGYDVGARAQQLRDDLRAVDKIDEAGLYAIQLDHRALFLQRWQRLLLEQVLTPDFVARNDLATYRQEVEKSADAARPDAVGYLLVREFRLKTLDLMFTPLLALVGPTDFNLRDFKITSEAPGWALIQAARADALPGGFKSWPELLQAAVLQSRDALLKKHGSLAKATWGADNPSSIKHPLSRAIPALGRWLDMPQDGLAGDSHMPRVANHGHGQSERFVVSPGHEERGILVVPAGQSGHPLSPFYAADHGPWLHEEKLAFLPGETRHRLILRP
jgi:penicillin amidase